MANSQSEAVTATSPAYDLCVVGAGPAGLAAALTAATGGLRVVVIDGGTTPGGQFWRQPARDSDRNGRAHLFHDLPAYDRMRDAWESRLAHGGITYLPRHEVWTLERSGASLFTAQFTAHALAADGSGHAVTARALVLAPGAYDRQVPFDGWELPGVFTAGAAQALLKEHGSAIGQRVVVAGTGPFLLPVATGLAASGVTVLGIHDANGPSGWAHHRSLVPLARSPSKVTEAAGYARDLARYRIGFHPRSAVVAAHGDRGVEAVTLARVDGEGRAIPGSEETVEVDALAVGWGFTPQLELPLAVGCRTRFDVDGSLVVQVDDRQESSAPGVYVAGEATGVGGAELAAVEGELAGLAAVASSWHEGDPATNLSRAGGPQTKRGRYLRRRRHALRGFAAALQRAYPVHPGWTERVSDPTLVCRCEEVPVSRLRHAVTELGASDVRTAKLFARPGMGWCQGRVCGFATEQLVASWTGRAPDPAGLAERPVAAPVPLGVLAAPPVPAVRPVPSEPAVRPGLSEPSVPAAVPDSLEDRP